MSLQNEYNRSYYLFICWNFWIVPTNSLRHRHHMSCLGFNPGHTDQSLLSQKPFHLKTIPACITYIQYIDIYPINRAFVSPQAVPVSTVHTSLGRLDDVLTFCKYQLKRVINSLSCRAGVPGLQTSTIYTVKCKAESSCFATWALSLSAIIDNKLILFTRN